jgi:carbon-monoxide dehydrogenase medium subunit
MRYADPETIEEAVALLAATEHARCLAGGAALVAAMNARRVQPAMLVSLHRIPALSGITEAADGVWIGAMTSHGTMAADERLRGAMAVVQSAAGQLAFPSIRNMGTIGGSIGLANPDTEIPVALIAAAARAEIAGPGATRTVPVEEIIIGPFQTSLAHGELITRVMLPAGIEGAVGHHLRYGRVHGDYPTVSISLVLAMDGDTCSHARVVLGSCGPVPLHVAAADARLVGTALGEDDIAAAGQILVNHADPVDDVRGTAEYRRMLIPRLLGRAIAQTREKLHV